MSRKYSIAFLLLSIACIVTGLAREEFLGSWGWVLFYPAVTFGLLAIGYAGMGPRLLFKTPSGQQRLVGRLLLAPYLMLNTGLFHLYRILSREPACVQIAPKVWFGRRLTASEAKHHQWVSVLDLAAEFTEVRPFRELPGYLSLPILDATAPSIVDLNSAVEWIDGAIEHGAVYVHCALGHGRSACVVVAYLLSIKAVYSVEEGSQMLRKMRFGVRLNGAQQKRLREWRNSLGL